MANRREVLQAGVALPALSLGGVALFPAAAASSSELLELDVFVCDERYDESVAAAREAAWAGLALHTTRGDTTQLWYERLDTLWRRRAVAIAGVTGEDVLFVLERLGWDRGLKVIYRGRHGPPVEGVARHEVEGAASVVRCVLNAHPDQWAGAFARALSGCAATIALEPALRLSAGATSPVRRDTALVSWLLAPAGGAWMHG